MTPDLTLSTNVDAIGIDAPFGFPQLITEALPMYASTERFTAVEARDLGERLGW